MADLVDPLLSTQQEHRVCRKVALLACAAALALGVVVGVWRSALAPPSILWPHVRAEAELASSSASSSTAHGCARGQGFTWCPALRRCVRPEATPCPLPRVLVTGFLPFGPFKVNPAELVARRVDASCTGRSCIDSLIIPVDHAGAALPARHLGRGSWDGVIHLGFEDEAKGLRLELVAANVEATNWGGAAWNENVPCNKSNTSWRYLDAQGPCLLATTAPLNGLELPLLKTGALPREIWSRDAGAFYCNEVYYRTLHAVRTRAIPPASGQQDLLPVIFVHLPRPEVSSVSESARFVQDVADRLSVQATCRVQHQ